MPEFLVGELVRQRMGALSASERRLGQVLLAFYPVAGLESLTRFAERAGVSPATVTRFITKLGCVATRSSRIPFARNCRSA